MRNLEAACFSGADLAYAQFGHANLGSANLSGARLEVWRSRDAGDCLHQKRIGRPLRQGLPLTRTSGRSWHKAEVSCLRVIRPLYGTERTIDFAMPMSAVTQSGRSQWFFLTGNKLCQVATFSAEPNESTRPGEVRASWLSFVTCLRRL